MRICFLHEDRYTRERLIGSFSRLGVEMPPTGEKAEYPPGRPPSRYHPNPSVPLCVGGCAEEVDVWLRHSEPTLVFVHWVQDAGWSSHRMMDCEVQRIWAASSMTKIVMILEPTDHDTCCLSREDEQRYRRRQYHQEASGGLYMGRPNAISPWVGIMMAASASGDRGVLASVLGAFASSQESSEEQVLAGLIAVALSSKAEDQNQILNQCAELFRDTPQLLDPVFQEKWAALFAP